MATVMTTPENSLAPGTRLDEFVIDRILGGGGFSIVYLAVSSRDNKPVVIKEYMPSTLATRNENMSVIPSTEQNTERFNHGWLRKIPNDQ